MNGQTPVRIVVRKKKGGHGGHHGGAWKVAYADFVTAMMALFIVLWLVGQNEKIKEAVAGYFKDPRKFQEVIALSKAGGGKGILEGQPPSPPAAGAPTPGERIVLVTEKAQFEEATKKLKNKIASVPMFDELKENLVIEMTNDGMRIEMLESEKGVFFASGSAIPDATGRSLLELLARELASLDNPIVIEGHTDSHPLLGRGDYTNWELSADRANSARRIMEAGGSRPGQVDEVRGYADHRLRYPDPYEPKNRRISIVVKYVGKDKGELKLPAFGQTPKSPAADPVGGTDGGGHPAEPPKDRP